MLVSFRGYDSFKHFMYIKLLSSNSFSKDIELIKIEDRNARNALFKYENKENKTTYFWRKPAVGCNKDEAQPRGKCWQNYCSLYNCVVKRASCEVERWICCIQIYICRIYCVGYTRNIYYRHEQRHTYMYMLCWATWSRPKRSKFSVVSLLFLRVGLVYFLFLPTVWLFIHSLLIFFFTFVCSLWLLETHTLWFEN